MCTSLCLNSLAFLLDKYLGVELLDQKAVVYVTFIKLELPDLFPKWWYRFAVPPAVSESSDCFTSSPTFSVVSLFNFSYSSGCLVVSHCGFNHAFSRWLRMLNTFSCAYWLPVWGVCPNLSLVFLIELPFYYWISESSLKNINIKLKLKKYIHISWI